VTPVPTAVLADALRKEIDDGTVCAAVLTTFVLEQDFLLDEVLPTFVPHTLSGNLVVRREELAETLSLGATQITVYADARQIMRASGGSRVPVAVVPVEHRTGVFHPKVTMVLVADAKSERLVVSVGSANLTRAGWWENVECAHVWSIRAGASSWCRDDLLSFTEYLRRQSRHRDDRYAATKIVSFLRAAGQRVKQSRASFTEPRFFWKGIGNRDGFAAWLAAMAGDECDGATLEIISPWYSDTGDVQVRELGQSLGGPALRVMVPQCADGEARMSADAVGRLGDDIEWGLLPAGVTRPGEKEAAARRVHAKAYRLLEWDREDHVTVVGSVNLTTQAFGARQNVEAAVAIGVLEGGTAWLESTDRPTRFVAPDDLDEEAAPDGGVTLAALTVVVDWQARSATSSWDGAAAVANVRLSAGALYVADVAITRVETPIPQEATAALLNHLQTSSAVLDVHSGDQHLGYTIVVEQHIERKPSADTTRTLADEVADLLLDGAERTSRTGSLRAEDADIAETELNPETEVAAPSVYENQAALFQALALMRRDLHALAEDGYDGEVRYRLVGHGSRCVGDLLDLAGTLAATSAADALVVTWAVQDLLTRSTGVLRERFRAELQEASQAAAALLDTLERQVIAANPADPEMARFLRWARERFAGRTP